MVTNEGREFLPSFRVEGETHPTGAGDAFAAGFLYGQFRGWDFHSSAVAGNLLASYCVQKMGAREGIPSKQEFEQRLEGVIYENQ